MHKFAQILSAGVFALSLVALDAIAGSPEPQATAAEPTTYGEAIDQSEKPLSLAAALKQVDREQKPLVAVFEGRVGEVCQKQGCWLQLLDGEQSARVMTKHRFVVPKDLSGTARVSGTLERIELSEEQARHMAEDAGVAFDPAASRVEYRIDARGLSRS